MRFSIRDILLLTFVIATGLGWFLHAKTFDLQIRALKADLAARDTTESNLQKQIRRDTEHIQLLYRNNKGFQNDNGMLQRNWLMAQQAHEMTRTTYAERTIRLRDQVNEVMRRNGALQELISNLEVTNDESDKMRDLFNKWLTEELKNYKTYKAAELLRLQQENTAPAVKK